MFVTKTMKVPRDKNGANGTSVLRLNPNFLNNNKTRATTVPIQKASSTAIIPEESPKRYPIPNINFTSPNPINLSFEPKDSKANGRAKKTPENSSKTLGTTGPEIEMNIEKKEIRAKARERACGITLCRMS